VTFESDCVVSFWQILKSLYHC